MRWWYGLLVVKTVSECSLVLIPSDECDYVLVDRFSGKILLKLDLDDIVRIVSEDPFHSEDSISLIDYLHSRVRFSGNVYISLDDHYDLVRSLPPTH